MRAWLRLRLLLGFRLRALNRERVGFERSELVERLIAARRRYDNPTRHPAIVALDYPGAVVKLLPLAGRIVVVEDSGAARCHGDVMLRRGAARSCDGGLDCGA